MCRSHLRLSRYGWAGAVLLLAALPTLALAQTPASGKEISVIVTLSDKVDPSDFAGEDTPKGLLRAQLIRALKAKAAATQAPLVGFLNSRGASRVVSIWLINGVAVTAPVEVIQELATLSGIESIRPDATVSAPVTNQAASAVAEWNLDLLRAPDVWALGQTGTGIIVANLDTGVDAEHPDLASRYRGGSNSWFDPNGEHASPYDNTGHGTQVMGLLVGGDTGGSAIGVAPDSQWIAVKIFDDAGVAEVSDIHQGFQWVLDPDGNPGNDDAADVVNNSWGYPEFVNQCYLEFETDLEVLKAAGIAVVFSGGNQGPWGSTSESPANSPEGFAVGAVDQSSNVASFSSRGPSACDSSVYPEVVAPGVTVRTTDLTFGGVFPDSYVSVTGTSFASPHVAGAMALLLSGHPTATVAQLEEALKLGAQDLGVVGEDNDSGFGLIDVVVANDLLGTLPPPPVCTDNDGDLFFLEADCGTQADCDDDNFDINPDACDIKGDGIDQDCDGVDRTKGKPCPSTGDGGGGDPGDTGGSEGKGQTCSDGLDNDGDGLIDCGDPDCAKNKDCK